MLIWIWLCAFRFLKLKLVNEAYYLDDVENRPAGAKNNSWVQNHQFEINVLEDTLPLRNFLILHHYFYILFNKNVYNKR